MVCFFFSNMSFMFYEGLVLRVDSRKTKKIFLFLTILTMLWCFPGLGMADKSCSEDIAGTMGAHWGTFSRYWCLWVVFGVSEWASNCDFPMWQWKTRDFLVFHDFDDVVVFSRTGYGWQKLFRAYCGYNGCTLEHFQAILMPLGRFWGLWRG